MTTIKLSEEPFISLEGEGLDIGVPTLFIRTFGCNLRCNGCDTPYSYESERCTSLSYTIEDLASIIAKSNVKRVSITGGEPTLQATELEELLIYFDDTYYMSKEFNLETNGTNYYPDLFEEFNLLSIDIKTPSFCPDYVNSMTLPEYIKKAKKFQEWSDIITEKSKDSRQEVQFKFVVKTFEDLEFIKNFSFLTNIIIQPFTPSSEPSTEDILQFIIDNNLNARLGLRMQNILNIK